MNRKQKNTLLPFNLDTPVSNLLPYVFERPILFVYSDTKLVELASYLALGPQIYADGLLVMQQHGNKKQDNFQGESWIARRKVIGQIGSKHIISHLLEELFDSGQYIGTCRESIRRVGSYLRILRNLA